MNVKKNSKLIVLILTLLILAGCAVWFIPGNEQKNLMSDSLNISQQVIADMGRFVSDNGLTDNLPESELQADINTFNEKVDSCYADEFKAKDYYKWLNEDFLTRVYKIKMNYIVKSGAETLNIRSAYYKPSRKEAEIHADIIGWSVSIQEENGLYAVNCAYSKSDIAADMAWENSKWKVVSAEVPDGDSAEAKKEEIIKRAEEKYSDGKLPKADAEKLDKIHKTMEICERRYETFSEALEAAKEIDLEDFNVYVIA